MLGNLCCIEASMKLKIFSRFVPAGNFLLHSQSNKTSATIQQTSAKIHQTPANIHQTLANPNICKQSTKHLQKNTKHLQKSICRAICSSLDVCCSPTWTPSVGPSVTAPRRQWSGKNKKTCRKNKNA